MNLKQVFPDAEIRIKKGELVWVGDIKPTSLSLTYQVLLRYRQDKAPRIHVLKPKLLRLNGSPPPHLYRDGSLCLYYPKHRQWLPNMLLAETIVPWASEYLAHYEVWLATGDWHGGGIH